VPLLIGAMAVWRMGLGTAKLPSNWMVSWVEMLVHNELFRRLQKRSYGSSGNLHGK
jgi:hypothetical protein